MDKERRKRRAMPGIAVRALALMAANLPAAADELLLEPDFRGAHVASVRVATELEVTRVVVHWCSGGKTAFSGRHLPVQKPFPRDPDGEPLAGITVMAENSVRAVAYPCPDDVVVTDAPPAVGPAGGDESLEGALF